jgi:hypothetical protein
MMRSAVSTVTVSTVSVLAVSVLAVSVLAVTGLILFSPVPAMAQGFQYGAESGSWDMQFDKRSYFPCYRWNSASTRSHDVGHRFHEPHGDRKKKARSRRAWDEAQYWLDEPRRPRCIGLWDSQR